ncbi:hypothetical protein [Streptomyces sp. MA15]|uniref:hypothetical protein n=1 Tax=Streptomyces sp. MA15 TaxID=3055061 RepID=UPI0025AF6C89|nr:hypothetical protein [Streptomyces sp. MA15]MDN3268480.1 hypothetical protein [Streptomyces sp. MA15]
MSDIRTCGIVVPTDWVPLPLEPSDDVRGWSKSTAVELCERGRAAGHELDRRTLRRDLRARAEDSRSRDPFHAFALYPDGFDSALALLEVDLIWPDETVSRITLDWLAETFSADDFGGPKVTHTELPVGPAVRIRQNLAMSGPYGRDPGVLLETVTYGVLPAGSQAAVMLLASWSVPGLTEEMEEAVDGIAPTLTVGF